MEVETDLAELVLSLSNVAVCVFLFGEHLHVATQFSSPFILPLMVFLHLVWELGADTGSLFELRPEHHVCIVAWVMIRVFTMICCHTQSMIIFFLRQHTACVQNAKNNLLHVFCGNSVCLIAFFANKVTKTVGYFFKVTSHKKNDKISLF